MQLFQFMDNLENLNHNGDIYYMFYFLMSNLNFYLQLYFHNFQMEALKNIF